MKYEINNNYVIIKNNTTKLYFKIVSDNVILKTNDIDYHSFSVENKLGSVPFFIQEEKDKIIIQTKNVKLEVNDDYRIKACFNDNFIFESTYVCLNESINLEKEKIKKLEGHRIEINETYPILEKIILDDNDKIYGLGDKTGFINKRDYEYINWNTDDPSVHADNYKSLYKSIPFFIVHNNKRNYGIFFDSTYKSKFDFGKNTSDELLFGDIKGSIEVYYIFGLTIKNIVREYTNLTGHCPLPQMWTLGFHQSRWSYGNETDTRRVVNKMKENHIPLDAIYLDIDYMDHYKIFTTGDNFPNFKKMVDDFNKENVKTVCIIDPGIKIEKNYFMYEEGIKHNLFATLNDKVYENAVWPGDSVFPNFNLKKTREWWQEKTHLFSNLGVAGIWTDMNEPASFKGSLPNDVLFNNETRKCYHEEIHNVYGHLMTIPTYNGLKKTEKRPFVITRACYAGTQKYSTVWTGDNHSIWSHLQLMIPQLCNLGLSGFPFCGTDIGGFGGDCTKELLIRWMEAAIFSPLFRNHSSIGSKNQEVYSFDEETINITRKYINLRYQLLPYIYDIFYRMQETGEPVMRPLVYDFEDDENVTDISDEFMGGDSILVAPIVERGKKERLVYLPNGIWYDYYTKEKYIGGKSYIIKAPLDTCPMFVKENSIIPKYEISEHAKISNTLILEVYGDNAEYIHYTDDAESFAYQNGEYNLIELKYQNGKEEVKYLHNGYKKYKSIKWIKVTK